MLNVLKHLPFFPICLKHTQLLLEEGRSCKATSRTNESVETTRNCVCVHRHTQLRLTFQMNLCIPKWHPSLKTA